MNKGWAGITVAMGAGMIGMAVAASVAAQGYGATRDWRTGSNTSSEASPCDKLSGRTRENCIAQIRRDDAQRGVTSHSASNTRNSGGRGSARPAGSSR